MITTNTQAAKAIAAVSREQLESLVHLQEMDNNMAKIHLELSELPVKLAAIELLLAESRGAVEEKKAEREALLKDYRGYEADFEANQARIVKREVQLREVKTNKEYQLVIREIKEIKEKGSAIEDMSLKCLDEIDVCNEAVAEREKVCLSVQSEVEFKKATMNRHAEMLREKLDETGKKGEKVRAGLDENLLVQYDIIRKRAGGIAIVGVRDAVCQGCHLNIPPQMYNELHKKDTVQICPHCYRLIYVELV